MFAVLKFWVSISGHYLPSQWRHVWVKMWGSCLSSSSFTCFQITIHFLSHKLFFWFSTTQKKKKNPEVSWKWIVRFLKLTKIFFWNSSIISSKWPPLSSHNPKRHLYYCQKHRLNARAKDSAWGWQHFHFSDIAHDNLLIFLKHAIQSINETYLNHMKCIMQYLHDKTNLL